MFYQERSLPYSQSTANIRFLEEQLRRVLNHQQWGALKTTAEQKLQSKTQSERTRLINKYDQLSASSRPRNNIVCVRNLSSKELTND